MSAGLFRGKIDREQTPGRGNVSVGVSIIAAFCLTLSLISARTVIAQEPDPEQTATELMKPAHEAVDRGLKFLVERQRPDGTFASRNMGANPAVVALGGMAFLSSGSSPGRGPYGESLDRSIDYLVSQTQPSGFICPENQGTHGPMYGHGFATLFMAEVYGMTPREDVRDALTSAVQLIVKSQNSEGGWRYQPVPQDADLSVTICQIMALRAARNAGIEVPNDTVDDCIDYVRKCQNPDGGFSYMLNQRSSMFPRSAAGIVALYSAGVYEGPEIDRGLAYLDRFRPTPGQLNRESHYYYGQYYGAQAMWQAGGERWQNWYVGIRDTLLAAQQPNGAWADGVAPEYATAMSCIILQIPNNALPIFQR